MHCSYIILHLSLIRGVSPTIVDALMRHEKLSIEIYQYTVVDMQRIFAISESAAERVVLGLQDRMRLDRELTLLSENKISWMAWRDEGYPNLLSHIHLPPPILYWQGNMNTVTQKSLAIVGARKADNYAKRVIDCLVPDLVAHNISVISGGAVGADAFAHEATIQARGYTVAVLGSGLLKKYPPQNYALFDRIVDAGGVVLSSFGLEMEPIAHNFPIRNRIIAGLSHGCLVVQAAEQSGASITAGLALDQGKDVFAVPGLIENPLSAGCHQLIQQGAKLVTSAADIITELGIVLQAQASEPCPQLAMSFASDQQSPCVKSTAIPLLTRETVAQRMNEKGYAVAEQSVALACIAAQSIDFLVEITNIPVVQLQNLLFCLQMDDVIYQDMQGLWRLNHDFFS